ncbi:MarR family winged helix-turn-helix transcriptional regulator [Ornithinimicrobium cerasi]|uniref:Transcriptional regulator, MarR family n=1 Tax=Ornithinimicrobium cerasi TaxID=2248773 RepID=A0A285VS01_9MICO|nr:MarR family transcriptional regulator [Ornithinimicrobium cerasi]SOC56368.1 transcriptional regulator, MarR family [Ornithinimicrobium cerasi]
MSDAPHEAGTRWLEEEEQHAWRAILRAGHLVRVGMEEALGAHDVSFGEYELLSMLSEAPGRRMRMAALADLIVQSRSRVSHTASRLERRGWVRRAPAPQDGRGVVLLLTDEGRGVLEKLAPVHVESVRRGLLDHLSREELVAYGEVMSRVVRATRASSEQASDAV